MSRGRSILNAHGLFIFGLAHKQLAKKSKARERHVRGFFCPLHVNLEIKWADC
jgi:hypothetical protein